MEGFPEEPVITKCGGVAVQAHGEQTRSVGHCRTTASDSISCYEEQTDFDFTYGQYFVFDENSASQIPIRHDTLSDDDVKVSLTQRLI